MAHLGEHLGAVFAHFNQAFVSECGGRGSESSESVMWLKHSDTPSPPLLHLLQIKKKYIFLKT